MGASSLAAGHKTLIPELVEALKKSGTRRYLRGRGWRHSAAGLRLPADAAWRRFMVQVHLCRQCARRTESDEPAS
ncbi:hypothetical protein ACNKHU_17590 [Shigella flexneri]